MKESYIQTNMLQLEFANTYLSKMFPPKNSDGTVKIKKGSKLQLRNYFDKTKYSKYEICEKILAFLKAEESWGCPGSKRSFNTFQLLRKYNVVKKMSLKNNFNKSYILLASNSNNKFRIRNQDQFHFRLVFEIIHWLNENNYDEIVDEFCYYIDNEPFVREDKITFETTEKTSGGNLRTDMAFIIGDSKIVVEYLENHHDRDKLIDHEVDRSRALRLICDNKNTSSKIVHMAFFWEKDLFEPTKSKSSFTSDKFKYFVNYIGKKIVDYYLIADENKYCINKLTEITGNESLSEQFYLAHNSQNEPVVKLDAIESLIKWAKLKTEKQWYNVFVDRVNKIKGEKLLSNNVAKKNFSAFDSDDDDSDDEDKSDNSDKSQLINMQKPIELIYYEIKNNEIYLTHNGLHLYLSFDPAYLINMLEYERINQFYRDITSGLINAIKDFRKIQMDSASQLIYGL